MDPNRPQQLDVDIRILLLDVALANPIAAVAAAAAVGAAAGRDGF